MSATNRGAVKIANDHYRTPASAYEPLYAVINWTQVDSLFDPTAGDGRLLDASPLITRSKWGSEIDPAPHYHKHPNVKYGEDYLRHPPGGTHHLGLTNPPFSLADRVLAQMLKHCGTVILLQSLNWLGGQNRHGLWAKYLPQLTHLMVLGKRPAFVGKCSSCDSQQHPEDGKVCLSCGGVIKSETDATEYGWFCWDRSGLIDLEDGVHRI